MAFPPQFLDDLRTRVPTSSVVGRKVKLTRKGREFSGLCPFHNEKSPSFFVNDDKGFYHCFGCGAHGDIVSFVMQTEGLGFAETVQRLAAEAGIPVPNDTPQDRKTVEKRQTLEAAMEAACLYFEQALRGPSGAPAREYLEKRGVPEADIGKFRLGWAPDQRDGLKVALKIQGFDDAMLVEAGLLIRVEEKPDPYDRFRGRVMFPICDRRGRVIAFGGRILGDGQPKYLNSPETPLFHKGRSLYALHHARPSAAKKQEIILAEGYMDVIALHRAGFDTAVAPLGTALTEEQMEELWRLAPEPILCLDGDSAGQKAMMRAALRALPLLKAGRSLRFATLPEGLDPDDLLGRPGGPARLREALTVARPLIDALWTGAQAGRALDTPERKAELSRDLHAQVATIADADVRRLYQTEIDQRLTALFGVAPAQPVPEVAAPAYVPRARQPSGKRGRWQEPDPFLKDRPNATVASTPLIAERMHTRALLAAFLNHPFLFDHWHEALADIEFADAGLDSLRREIVNVTATRPGLDADALQSHLAESEHAFMLSHVMQKDVAGTFPFTRREAFPQDVRAKVAEIFGRLMDRRVAEDRRLLMAVTLSEETAEAWARYKALFADRARAHGGDEEEGGPMDAVAPS
ncbi:DNA primase [Elstera cyanobacteriorum]|uniref:DNA primase n=1 Tax=Elstera cyanobacteriorum TaxID=2022747 RepID=A0A255XZA4_9PROT|nr:DNA primase [Elstera cyanobacteriorum]OYQ21560.1 DNA primase [Elstera cyanobacteriorum]GGA00425.1 DNA primase [Elstera cyanobacteriorum]